MVTGLVTGRCSNPNAPHFDLQQDPGGVQWFSTVAARLLFGAHGMPCSMSASHWLNLCPAGLVNFSTLKLKKKKNPRRERRHSTERGSSHPVSGYKRCVQSFAF